MKFFKFIALIAVLGFFLVSTSKLESDRDVLQQDKTYTPSKIDLATHGKKKRMKMPSHG